MFKLHATPETVCINNGGNRFFGMTLSITCGFPYNNLHSRFSISPTTPLFPLVSQKIHNIIAIVACLKMLMQDTASSVVMVS